MKCKYCKNNSNPFKYDYMPLVFAWRPVSTDRGIVFLSRVHKRTNVSGWENYAGSYPSIWYTYYKCQKIKEK